MSAGGRPAAAPSGRYAPDERRTDLRAAAAAIAVLEKNWRASHTLPAAGLYPHQWSWDSAFIAMGLRHVSARRAGRELDALLSAQWDDGRIPQIVFDPHRDDDYAPGAAFWRSSQIAGAPRSVQTAGLVQPPNHAWAVWAVHEADPTESARRHFLERAYPRLVAWHEYLRTRRDRGGRGLVSIVHPWESGTDNSPLWDATLATVPDRPLLPVARRDLAHAGAGERPSDRDYDRYFWLAERYRDHDCDDRDADYPFLVEDPMFNALLAISELSLARIAAAIGRPGLPHVERATEMVNALEALWSPELGLYSAADARTGTRVDAATVNGLIPLLLTSGPHTQELFVTLEGPRFLGKGAHLVPSFDVTAPGFAPSRYWRGPAWFNMAWLIAAGAAEQGRADLAADLRRQMVRLAVDNGFPEYVNPFTGTPHGTRGFSWTAALVLDVLSASPTRLPGNGWSDT